MKIWAHRGCSQRYPENTEISFRKAAEVKGLEGIELDVQLTKDGEMVVIHDERVDRTTDGIGFVKDFTLKEIKELSIKTEDYRIQKILKMEEVIDLLHDELNNGLKINIELKTGVYPYPGIEEKIIDLVHRKGIEDNIIYSSFYANTIYRLRQLDPDARLAILDSKVSDCIWKIKGGCGAVDLHPFWRDIDVPAEELRGYKVRAWMSGHLYPEKPTGKRLNLQELEEQGITDIILNEPEVYL